MIINKFLIILHVGLAVDARGFNDQSKQGARLDRLKKISHQQYQLKSDHMKIVTSIARGGFKQQFLQAIPTSRGGSKNESSTKLVSSTSKPKKSTSLFPIYRSELPHFLCMSLMMFLFIYVFTTVRDTKDTLVVSNCGAEAIPFLKLYGVMPAAFLFLMIYSKLSQNVGQEMLFYLTLIPFFIFYALFAFVLFPNRDVIHVAKDIAIESGAGKAAYSLVKYWSYSLYFIVSELWASAGVPLLFWQVANDVTPLHQAKRFYPLFAVIGNLAPILSGKVMSYIVSLQKRSDDEGFAFTLQSLASIKVAICIGIITLYKIIYSMNTKHISAKEEQRVRKRIASIQSKITNDNKVQIKIERSKQHDRKPSASTKTELPKNKKPSLSESMVSLSQSKELKAIATMVFCYNACVELTEVLWKGILRKSYPNKAEYMSFMANFSQQVGVVALILQLSASWIIETLGWRWSASLTPLSMVALAIPFFTSIVFIGSSDVSSMTESSSTVTLAMVLMIGTWQNIVSKVTKYSLFDPCKEMSFIPLGPDAKIKGKAAVDVLGARLGRSMGSASQQLLVSLPFIGHGNILNCSLYIGVVYVFTVGYWLKAVNVLSALFNSGDDGRNNKVTKKKEFKN